jgi:hypothetical protein
VKEILHSCLIGTVALGIFLASGTVVTLWAADDSEFTSTRTEEDEKANQMAREVFLGDEYWWKRTTDLKSGSVGENVFSLLYRVLIRPVLKTIFDVIEWILKKLFGSMRGAHGDWSRGIPFLWTIIVLLLAYVGWRMWVASRGPAVSRPAPGAPDLIDVLPRADQLLEQSRAALLAGDHRSAIRLAFLSLLAWFQDRGQLKYDPSRSNREYQRDLRKWPDSVASFRAAAGPFERCWYGGRTLSAEQVEDVIALCQQQFQSAKGIE